MSVQFEDYTVQVEGKLDETAVSFLYEVAELLRSQVVMASPVKTGQLRGSWQYSIDEETMEATIGSPLENAIWNEFGTGEYALHGDGRKGGWSYKDDQGNWHRTKGKKPRRSLFSSFEAKKASIIKRAEQIFKDGMK